jgi:hypothetical protein
MRQRGEHWGESMLMLGRILISLATLITLIGPNIADWNDTHVFSELWSPHAHFHGAWSIFTTSLLSLLCLWLLWVRSEQPQGSRIAGLIQAAIWLAFFPALFVPGIALADPGKRYEQILGLDVNLFFAIVEIVLLAIGLVLILRAPKTAPAS